MKKKLYAVVWGKKAAKEYGCAPYSFTTVEPKEEFKVPMRSKIYKRKFFYGSPLAIFATHIEASAFHAGNTDWEVVRLNVSYD